MDSALINVIGEGTVAEHDNVIENFVHISVGAKLTGVVTVGKVFWIGGV